MLRYRNLVALAAAGLAVLMAGAFSAGQPASGPGPSTRPECDAKFIKMEIPAKVLTDQVFLAKITMRNTGTATWQCTGPVHLFSQEPARNSNWGTSIIRTGQGATVKPGDECVFTSNLKAPGTPGKVVFKWQLARGETFVGEATSAETIQVDKRPEEPTSAPAPRDASEKKVLTFADFEYAGSFKLPDRVEGGASTWSESGIALRKMKDGSKRLFVNYTHPAGVLFEVEIPPLVKLEDYNHAALKLAEVKKVWGALKAEGVGANAGIWWDEAKGTLYWSTYHGYKTGDAWPVLAASKLGDDGKVTPSGPWFAPVGWYKSYWGGVTKLAKDFADKYTGGKTLAVGFGGYYSIFQQTSRGPALAAIAEPDPAKKNLEVVDLVAYPAAVKDAYAPRDGNYFLANIWGEQPDGPRKGFWTPNDFSRSGVFIDLPKQHGFIAFASLATGRVGYDASAIYSAGSAQWWYCYDPKDLGDVAKGAKKPWQVVPFSTDKVEYPRAGKPGHPECITHVTGACFDDEEKLLYVYKPFCIPVGREETFPCIFVYRVKQPG